MKEHAKLDSDLRPIQPHNRYLINAIEAGAFGDKEEFAFGFSTLVAPQIECPPISGTPARDNAIRKTTHINVCSTSHLENQCSTLSQSDS